MDKEELKDVDKGLLQKPLDFMFVIKIITLSIADIAHQLTEGVSILKQITKQEKPKDDLITHEIYRDMLSDVLSLVQKSDKSVGDRNTILKRLSYE